jgi:hypothetical protein
LVDSPLVDSPAVGMRREGSRSAGNRYTGNRAAARSPGGAAVKVDHGSHTVEHPGISQRAAVFAGLSVRWWRCA